MPKKSNKMRADGRIAVQIYLGVENGKRKYKTVYGKSQKEADDKAEVIKAKMRKGYDVVSEADLFSVWCDRWLAMKKSETSLNQYNAYFGRSKYFSDTLGKFELRQIKPHNIQKILEELAEENPYTKKPSSKKTLSVTRNTAVQIFDYAIANRAIDYNPARLTKVAKSAPQEQRRALSKEEQRWIREYYHRAQRAAMIMMYAGLRRGELTALLWEDIDLTNGTITVNKSYDFKSNTIKETKTSAGKRIVNIPNLLIKYLKTQERSSSYVITGASNKPMTGIAWRRLWESYICELNIKYGAHKVERKKCAPQGHEMKITPFTPHCLRHTYCTMLYEAGVDVLVAKELMGHSDVKTTLAIYTHLSKEHKEKDITKLDKFLGDISEESQA